MEAFAAPAAFALLLWWWSTGAILWLVGLPRASHPWSMAAVTLLLLPMALWGLVASGSNVSPFGVYLAFTSAIGVWAWHEMTFLFGYVTGPNRRACVPGAVGFRRLLSASATVIYHELALALTAGAIFWLLWEAPNQIALWTFLALWIMRLSAKLNIYFGVPNMTEEFLQPHLAYLTGYFRKGPVTPFFALTVTAGTGAFLLAVWRAVDPATPLFETIGMVLVATLLLLAVVEHWFLVLPLRDAALWRWALRDAAPGRLSDGDDTRRESTQLAVCPQDDPVGRHPVPIGLSERRVSATG
ncbi:putative photosynthetic complex assembly protein PuhE [Algihabitans sp.]|uniref:putative photosynthetic complex assembly protein PuhE n=1 Tax=Algihabitans sp. TaxID=2821514 RepID=UPI003BA96B81